ncbi:MAG: hypothetical protein EBR10_07800 [Planctomycetes bacterium]|nr:hypothetical protein [Planctomycetota bacterium]
MPSPVIHDQPVPCPDCGYDLRGSSAPQCPECGCSVSRASVIRSQRSSNLDDPQSGGDSVVGQSVLALDRIRRNLLWTLPLWLGCVGLPGPGTLLWLLLTIGSAARCLTLWQLRREQVQLWNASSEVSERWWLLARAEMFVALGGGILLVLVSFSKTPAFFEWLLVLVQCAWAALIALANLTSAQIGLRLIMAEGEREPSKHLGLVTAASLAGAALVQPLLLLGLLPKLPPQFEWVAVGAVLLFIGGCLAGIGSLVLTREILEDAASALREGDRARRRALTRDREDALARAVLRQQMERPVRPPEHPRPAHRSDGGDGKDDSDDPIPLADEDD